jgi:pyruvate/2-oxoglutarate/acetoin dehydrogenase E1 component/TPP-dependent pyruvate/acetoin dehydrogenase alpha subunit
LETAPPVLKKKNAKNTLSNLPSGITKEQILEDYLIGFESRQISLLGRKEVFAGKAKFGIFGDGKEVPQLAMARVFEKGDFRSGYYRDQTFMMAIGGLTSQQFFAQLYAHSSLEDEPSSGGRQMSCHFSTRFLDEKGNWKNLTQIKNSSSDISPTAAQMPRLLGLAYASKLFRNNPELKDFKNFSINGNEIAFGTIGNASTSEGIFFEAMNAAGVLQVPMLVSVWDDDYGISVPKEYHTTKGSISEAMKGFEITKDKKGIKIFVVKGWDYPGLLETYKEAVKLCRDFHVPVLIHVTEATQPQGHSTSGSHERYKSKERLEWEKDHDCMSKMKEWILSNDIASEQEIQNIELKATENAKNARNSAWKAFNQDLKKDHDLALQLINEAVSENTSSGEFTKLHEKFTQELFPVRSDTLKAINQSLRILRNTNGELKSKFIDLRKSIDLANADRYNSNLYSVSENSATHIEEVLPTYDADSPVLDGREILQAFFDMTFAVNPLVFAIGEDVGKIGDVNQGFAGLQEKYGEIRISDTGIRECTIAGQGIGAALRGLRPIIEIQYLDYLMYALQILTDDLATLQYRTKGGQKAPLIIRTRGHRLEGVWHAGSPLSVIINSLRGIYVLTPRNMTKAAGFYNTLLKSDEPGLVIECLNGYRLKEKLPSNIGDITVPIGVPEILREGKDVTIVTYGSMTRICMDAAALLDEVGIDAEVIDAQSLLPFDIHGMISKSLEKTNRIVFADEDVPGGATAYMMQQVLEIQAGYKFLDSQPKTITAHPHRPAYASDGDYFSKPSADNVFEVVYELMSEAFPTTFSPIF